MAHDPRIRRRIRSLLYILITFHVIVVGYALFIQQVKGEDLRRRGQRMHRIPLQGRRGALLDVHGRKLAMDVKKYSICAFPGEIEDAAKVTAELSEKLELEGDVLRRRISSKKDFVWVKRLISDEEAEIVKELDLPGVTLLEEMGRVYPNNESAAALIGFKGTDEGIEGAEYAFEEWLHGAPGYLIMKKDAARRSVPFSVRERVDPRLGADVYLTVDMTVQFFAEQELKKSIEKFNATAGSVIVMDPRNGAILAMAGYPSFDPNRFQEYSQIQYRNRPIWKVFEPGSVLKPVVTAMAIDAGVVDPFKDKFECTPWITLGGFNIREHDAKGLPAQKSVTEIIAMSYNTGSAKIALRMDVPKLQEYVSRFNFGHRYEGLRLNGQERGILPPSDQWRDVNVATIGFGQGIGTTSLQVATAFSALANGGVLYEPTIVDRVVSVDGEEIYKFEPRVIRRVISSKTSRIMKYILHQVVEEGTGGNAQIANYTVAGKTGTAQVPGPNGYQHGKYISSFIGFAPVDDPRVLVMVTVEEPRPVYYASEVAAPAFREIMRKTLWHLDVPPSSVGSDNTPY